MQQILLYQPLKHILITFDKEAHLPVHTLFAQNIQKRMFFNAF